MTVEQLAPYPVQQFTDANGVLLAGGKLFTYAGGTSTKLATYTDNAGSTPNTNPIILNARGECQIWIPPATAYKFVLAPATDTDPPTNPIWTVDQITNPVQMPLPSSSNELYYVRVNAGGTAYETRTPAQVLADIGAAPATGSTNYAPISVYGGQINANTTLLSSATTTVYEIGSGSTAPFTITLPTPSANLRFRFIGSGGSYAASITTPSGGIILPDGTTATLPYAGTLQQLGFSCDFFADGTNWVMGSASGQAINRAAVNPNQVPQAGQLFGGPSAAGVPATMNLVTGSRALGTTYTNSQGKPIWVCVEGSSTGAFAQNLVGSVAGVAIMSAFGQTNALDPVNIAMIVPAGATYKVAATNVTLSTWNEFY